MTTIPTGTDSGRQPRRPRQGDRPPAGPVTITRADGTVEVRPPLPPVEPRIPPRVRPVRLPSEQPPPEPVQIQWVTEATSTPSKPRKPRRGKRRSSTPSTGQRTTAVAQALLAAGYLPAPDPEPEPQSWSRPVSANADRRVRHPRSPEDRARLELARNRRRIEAPP